MHILMFYLFIAFTAKLQTLDGNGATIPDEIELKFIAFLHIEDN